MSGHSKLSPSGSAQWLSCPASVEAIELFVEATGYEDESSPFAIQGTDAHELGEFAVHPNNWGADLNERLGDLMSEGTEVDEEMIDAIEAYRNYVKQYANPDGSECYVEVDLPLFYKPEDTGQADFICYNNETKTLHVIDLKYGMGVVEAENNTQCIIYAISAYDDFINIYDIEQVEWHIVQPRRNHFDSAGASLETLEEWRVKILQKALEILSGKSYEIKDFGPSEKGCKWCPLSGQCKAQAGDYFAEIADDPEAEIEEVVLKTADMLSGEDISKILSRYKEITSWLKALHSRATESIEKGIAVPGLKLVATQKNRAWTDPEAADKLLKQKLKQGERYKTSLITPTQADKLLKGLEISSRYQNKFDGLVTRDEGAPALVPESDKREALTFGDDFDSVDSDVEDFLC